MRIISTFHDHWKSNTENDYRFLRTIDDPATKEHDFIAWAFKQIGHLERQEFDQVDNQSLIEELTRFADEQLLLCRSLYSDMVQFLILLSTAPGASIDNHIHWKQQLSIRRIQFQTTIRKNPSIRRFLDAIYQFGWDAGRLDAIRNLSSGSYISNDIRHEVLTAERVAGPWEERLTTRCPWSPVQIISYDPANPYDALTNSYELPFEVNLH